MQDAGRELRPANQFEPVWRWHEVGPYDLPERARRVATEVLRRARAIEDGISRAEEQLAAGQADHEIARERVHEQPVVGTSRTPTPILLPMLVAGEDAIVERRLRGRCTHSRIVYERSTFVDGGSGARAALCQVIR